MARFDGSSKNDKWTGTDGNDEAYGYAGNDVMHGGAGIDHLEGGLDNDVLYGDAGTDYLYGQDGDDKLLGGADNDFLDGGAGNDRLDGGDGDDRLTDLGGSDTLIGGKGNDTLIIQGNAGDTTGIDGGAGDDLVQLNGASTVTLQGGAGKDVLDIHTAVLHQFSAANGFELFRGDGFVSGTGAADSLDFSGLGTDEAGRIYCWQIDGGAGDDRITGTFLADQLSGGADNDVIFGGAGNDNISGGSGTDELHGGDGNDTIYANGDGAKTIYGEAGADNLSGGDGDDVIDGGADDDTIAGFGGDHNILSGGDGNDTIASSGLFDSVSGGAGDDTLRVQKYLAQLTLLDGGDGVDTLVLGNRLVFHDTNAEIRNIEQIDLGQGAGSVIGTDVGDTLDFSRFRLVGGGMLSVDGGAGNDAITGTAADDLLYGKAGNDVIEGGLGNDRIVGGVEDDFSPGLDMASYEHAAGAVTVSLALNGASQNTGAAGWDTIEQCEGLIGSAYGDTLGGSDAADRIEGRSGNDTINAGLGSDIVYGGDGDDVITGGGLRNQDPADPKAPVPTPDQLVGGAGADTYLFGSGLDLGIYYVNSAMRGGGLVANVEFNAAEGDRLSVLAGQHLTFVGDGALQLGHSSFGYVQNDKGTLVVVDYDGNGTADASIQLDHHVDLQETSAGSGILTGFDLLLGTDKADRLTGGAGNESLRGLGGMDWLEGGAGNDRIDGGDGRDTASYLGATAGVHVSLETTAAQDTGGAGVDTLVNVEDLAGSNYGDVLAGNGGANTIQGRDGNDVIDGHGGYDQLVGGAGADTYVFTSWSDWNVGTGKGGALGGQLQLDSLDRIDMTGLGDFTMLGHNAFTAAGHFEVRFEVVGSQTLIQADVNGDGTADYNYWVNDVTAIDRSADGHGLVRSDGPAIFTIGTGGDDIFTGTQWNDEITGLDGQDQLYGGDGNDFLYGQNGWDHLNGGAGHDVLIGGEGGDLLDGGTGADVLMGGTGDDVYIVDNSADHVIEGANEGTDSVTSTVSYALGDNVERLTLDGGKAIDGTGNGLDNLIVGNSASNVISGASGNDTLLGGAGHDRIYGGDGVDILDGGNDGDTLWGGGDADTFRFSTVEGANGDKVADLQTGDKLDFSWIDANPATVGDDGFSFLGTGAFTGHAGEIRFVQGDATHVSTIWADLDGDKIADIGIQVNGDHLLVQGDFVL